MWIVRIVAPLLVAFLAFLVETPLFRGGVILLAGLMSVALFYPIYRVRQAALTAATELKADLTRVNADLSSYQTAVGLMIQSYTSAGPVPSTIPNLRLQLDRVKFESSLNGRLEKFTQVVGSIPWRDGLYRRTHAQLVLFSGQLDLLRASKLNGFMRSSRILEEYINRSHSSPVKKVVVDSFAEDYYDETVYSIVKSLTSERDVFNSSNMQFVLAQINADLSRIIRVNPWWCFWPW